MLRQFSSSHICRGNGTSVFTRSAPHRVFSTRGLLQIGHSSGRKQGSNSETLEALDSLLGTGSTRREDRREAQWDALSDDDDPELQSTSDSLRQPAPVTQSKAASVLSWANAALGSALGGPLAIPGLQEQANATLEMPKLQPYMSYLLYYAHILIYVGIFLADVYWGPGSAGDLRLDLSNDHLAVQSGGELWRLVTCTFVHTSPINLFITLAALLLLAADLERAVGLWVFAAVVSLGTTSGTVADLLLNDLPITTGATPAIVATVGALLVEKRKNFLFHEKVENARQQQRQQQKWRLDSAAAIRQARRPAPVAEAWSGYEQGYSSYSTIRGDSGSSASNTSGGSSRGGGDGSGGSGSGGTSSSLSSTLQALDIIRGVRSSSDTSVDDHSSSSSNIRNSIDSSSSDIDSSISVFNSITKSEGAGQSSSSSSSSSSSGSGDGGGSGMSSSSSLPARSRNRVVLSNESRADGANVMDGWGMLPPSTQRQQQQQQNTSSHSKQRQDSSKPASTLPSSSAASSTATLSSSSSSSSSSSGSVTLDAGKDVQIRRMEPWEGYDAGYSTSVGTLSKASSQQARWSELLPQQLRARRKRRYIEPKGPKEQRQELATVEIFEGLFKFSGVVSSENKAWLSVAATFFTCVDALKDFTSADDCTISIAGVVGAFIAGGVISLGLSPQYTVVLEPVLASSSNTNAPPLSPEQQALISLPTSSQADSMSSWNDSLSSMRSTSSLDSLDEGPQGEDRYVWGLAVRDKVPMTQRFLTVTTALALLSYVVYELLI